LISSESVIAKGAPATVAPFVISGKMPYRFCIVLRCGAAGWQEASAVFTRHFETFFRPALPICTAKRIRCGKGLSSNKIGCSTAQRLANLPQ